MLRIYRIDHIAVATPDLEGQAALLEGLFGFERTHTFDDPATKARCVRLGVPGAPGQYWLLLSPPDPNTALGRWLDDRGGRPGLHHVGAEVPDLEAALAEVRHRGLEIADSVPGSWAEVSLSPPAHGPGVLWRLYGPGAAAVPDDAAAPAAPRSAADAPTLGIRGIDHLCQAFPDRDALAAWYTDLAGFVEVWRTPEGAAPDMADLVLNVPGSSICWEVITGRGDDSFVDRFLQRSGPAAHHVTFEVADWENALAACSAHGVPTFGEEEGVTDGAAWKHTFIHPKHAGGVLVQLFWEQRPGVWVRSDKIAPLRSA
ncbi:VOC family protein [Streptomyces sp. NPDC059788]|uniref:VOC family protein n=1 Tax=Streptomyces sp. NPDC059788 TaxID=3346948 RepID=UPI003658B496